MSEPLQKYNKMLQFWPLTNFIHAIN